MFRSRDLAAFAMATLLSVAALAGTVVPYSGIGRDATPKEIAAWNIDVRPDFQGLPPGSGAVSRGQDVWEEKCASCHGIFGDSGEVFSPIIGGIKPDDIKTGHVANLKNPTVARTTFMKVATLSTVWDFINRAMPWNAPKSLKTDDVYAVTAYLLNLSGIVPDDFVLSDKNIAEVQKRMPNRNGMTTKHAMWPGKDFGGTQKPDVIAAACMKNCEPEPKITSFLPEFARNAHGNLAEQNRTYGPIIGADTLHPEGTSLKSAKISSSTQGQNTEVANPGVLAIARNNCVICHAVDRKVVGPAFTDVAKKYPNQVEYLSQKIKTGGSGVWGQIMMPPQNISDADLKIIANWIATGAAK